MKKIVIVFIAIFLIILTVLSVSLIENSKNLNKINKQNEEYEKYLDKEIFGTDVITVINKVTNENNQNNIEKDDKGFYIENKSNSIKVELIMLNDKKTLTYQMETIQKAGIDGFIKNFNLISFKCINIEYHNDTKKVRKMIFKQIEE